MTRQRGFILITSLVFLVIMTLLGVSMFGNSSVEMRMAGNIKAKVEARALAESGIHHAETLLLDTNVNPLAQKASGGCSGSLSVPTICVDPSALLVISTQNSSGATAYRTELAAYYADPDIPNLAISATPGTPNSTYAAPEFYIRLLGASPDGAGQLYQITALGYGGTPEAVSVLQANFEVTSGVINHGGV